MIIIIRIGKIAFRIPYMIDKPVSTSGKPNPATAMMAVAIRVIKALLSPDTFITPSRTINKITGITDKPASSQLK